MEKTEDKERNYKIVDVTYLGDQGFCDLLEKLREDGWEFAGVLRYDHYSAIGTQCPYERATQIIVRRVKGAG